MSSILLITIAAFTTASFNSFGYASNGEIYYAFPKFWTNTGFCPAGRINHREMKRSLLSDATQLNLKYIAALPVEACTHVRVHWLLQLVRFVQHTQEGVPIYDFTDLDTFLDNLNGLGLQPVIEFMGNPGKVFSKNPARNAFLWEDFSFQITKRYLDRFGAKVLLKWRFETWNEPDVEEYNRLKFTTEDFLEYVNALRRGLNTAGRRSANSLFFPLRGPAGLFKSEARHPLCWQILEQCNENLKKCPLATITYHKKGDGEFGAAKILNDSMYLFEDIYGKFPLLKSLPISNDEADPITNWSEPRDFQEDVRYAYTLVLIVLMHWSAKLKQMEFKSLESLSHDNAFLSYHPYEFSQRTLLAHFHMNETHPIHSQFIQKPVYAALGMLAKLAPLASDLETLRTPNGSEFYMLKTLVAVGAGDYLSYLLLPKENTTVSSEAFSLKLQLPLETSTYDRYFYIIELLDNELTSPSYVWHQFQSPPYPNAKIREEMRRSQVPLLLASGILDSREFAFSMNSSPILSSTWILLFRCCSNRMRALKAPLNLVATQITHHEVLLTWFEVANTTQCLKTYEIWFQSNTTDQWTLISKGWHLPFPSFHYAPNSKADGFYKVRGLDIFDRHSQFSEVTEYLEI